MGLTIQVELIPKPILFSDKQEFQNYFS